MKIVWAPSPNFDTRAPGKAVDMLVLHYTGMESMAAALSRMRDPDAKVSAHYMIDEDGTIYQLVDESHRAWHAGVSFWAGQRDINSISIGVELVNRGHAFPGYVGGYHPFPEPQMVALEVLAADIVRRYGISPIRVLGHSDVAPARKKDPGELFDWNRMMRAGVGVVPAVADHAGGGDFLQPGMKGPAVAAFKQALARFGYEIDDGDQYDEQAVAVVTAFQRHYRQDCVDGVADTQTQFRLARLLTLVV